MTTKDIEAFVYLNTGILESIYHSQVEPVLGQQATKMVG